VALLLLVAPKHLFEEVELGLSNGDQHKNSPHRLKNRTHHGEPGNN
jgi:hypothetical protein